MDFRVFLPFLCAVAVACETVPASMDQMLFDTEVSRLSENPSIAASDRELGILLARQDLTDVQRADLLWMRAEKRLDARFDLPGALRDFETFGQLQPEDSRAAMATRRMIFVAEEIESAQRRLARLQNHSDWFDDKVLMGEVAAGAARYRGSGLTPNEAQVYLLREGGFICDAADGPEASPVHQYGDMRDDVSEAVWCDDPSLS
ncbi:MAG: hypothetical protein AAF437_12570 [Pseudomonadota bacterium]